MNNVIAIAQVVLLEMVRRKDVYVLFVLSALISLAAASVNVFNEASVVGYIKEICLLLIWVSAMVIAVVSAARQLPAEREQRTIYPLLAKPVTRAEVVLGKFAGCWISTGLTLVLFYAFFAGLTAFKSREFDIAAFVQAVWLHWMALGVVTAMALLGSLVFAAPSSNATICFVVVAGILLMGRHLNKVAAQLAEPAGTLLYAGYFLIPHLEWYDLRDLLIHHQDPVPWLPWLLATPYALAYTALFLFLTWLQFRRASLD